ncbi:kinesin-like protein KIN-10A isoform X1 [Juglans microcarpa x Juglans regia]|uniref:kinesin-like protein KIN-10A isoform X1 n=1 Tax=Juglans microcarpa x Juglans regia TaxID=2249226 RepID=UPI001B7EE759|nr:kinesin-like protein KIN-10A isoform X1 [Juglans microcarpa x Juglans regia]
MAPTPSSKANQTHQTHMKTPQSKLRIHFNATKTNRSPNLNAAPKETPQDHPVEVIGRIRDHPDRKDKAASVLHINSNNHSIRVRADFGYRDFCFDGVSLSEEEDLDVFYKKFVESRISSVKLGDKCTIMMYGPTGSGKSHTMFGCLKQPGIVYRSLRDILGDAEEEVDSNGALGTFVQVTVLEIYNEEIYDLLSSNGGGGLGLGWPKGSASKVKLEVMGKKAKNAAYISGNDAGKISKEIQKVEKRRIVRSTLCNDRSSRSHCMIILDVPTVGGRLMLVDMAGSENIEQAGQIGFEAKMQTAKINQGNIALKRVVESIANGDSHVPFRDSKLTMLLQDSFEDDKSKILMILCASPDPKEIHKTISTLEYGAKAKCIVRGPHMAIKNKIGTEDSSSAVILGSRIAAMDEFILKLQRENKLREKERNEAHKELLKKEEEVAALRARLEQSGASEEEINLKVNERTQILKHELEKKLEECQRMTNEFVELERRRMEERILQQQKEVEILRQRLEEIESELCHSRDASGDESASKDMDGSGFAKRLLRIYTNEDPGMVKSMDLDMDDQEPVIHEVKHVGGFVCKPAGIQGILDHSHPVDHAIFATKLGDKVCLSTVFEEEEGEEEQEERVLDEEVDKEIIEEKVCTVDQCSSAIRFERTQTQRSRSPRIKDYLKDALEDRFMGSESISEPENAKESASSRRLRIQNIFTLCGNHRELSQHIRNPVPKRSAGTSDPQSSPVMKNGEDSVVNLSKENLEVQKSVPIPGFVATSQVPTVEPLTSVKEVNEQKLAESQLNKPVFNDMALASKENYNPSYDGNNAQIDVHVKWEASRENPGKFITTLKVVKDASLADLRKLIEIHLGSDNQAFTFLVLGDQTGAPVPREKEGLIQAIKLPLCNKKVNGHLACLRSAKGVQCPSHLSQSPLPLRPLENKLPLTPNSRCWQPGDSLSPNYSSTPYITDRRHPFEQL